MRKVYSSRREERDAAGTLHLKIELQISQIWTSVLRRTTTTHKRKVRMSYANLDDVKKLREGTARFTFQEIAYQGLIAEIDYVPLGPGAINVQLLSLQPVAEGPEVPDIPLNFTISCFMAEVTNKPRELVINQLVSQKGFGCFFSFRVKD